MVTTEELILLLRMEKRKSKQMLIKKIDNARHRLNQLEIKVREDEKCNFDDGVQHDTIDVDIWLGRYLRYQEEISDLEHFLKINNKE